MLTSLRRLMAEQNLDAYVIPATDPHISEYLPAHWRILEWASGFTGSAGTLVITRDFAGLWTDSRYFVQAEAQLAGSGVQLVKLVVPHTPEFVDWLAKTLPEGATVGVDGNLMSRNWFRAMEKGLTPHGIRIDAQTDLVEDAWTDRPTLPLDPVYEHPAKFAGASCKEKLARIRQILDEKGLDYTVFSTLDDLAWTFNLRGTDVPYNPLFVGHAVVGKKSAALFIDERKMPDAIRQSLQRAGVQALPYGQIRAYLSKLPSKASILIDPARTSQNLPGALPPEAKVVEGVNITTLLKACKTSKEIEHTRRTMVKDGAVLTKFFYWLQQSIGKERVTELSTEAKLHALRKEQEGCIGESFGTIAAYREHAALPHYKSSAASDVELKPEGLFLLDSGGQYLGGTTDTTRVISLGKITDEERRDYTLVLKGMIALCNFRFPKGTRGFQIDALARSAMWQHGINFGHGTGHGVGYFLNVHEGPQAISPNPGIETPFIPGMITSVEPGIYRPGKHGVRLENLVLCVQDDTTEFGEFLRFESLTIAPIFTNLVDKSLLTAEERRWLRDYNRLVVRKVGRYLSAEEKAWLVASVR
jgi:Xaa-Pro aminopeptidase